MNGKNSKHFENGRRKALAEIEAKIAAARGEGSPAKSSGDHVSKKGFFNIKPRDGRERLGLNSRELEYHREQAAFQNAVNAGQITTRRMAPLGSGQKTARASDGLNFPTPADIRRSMEANREARAELHRIAVQNRNAARRRLGLESEKKSKIKELLTELLDSED